MEADAVCNAADRTGTDCNDVIEIRPSQQCQDTVLEAQPDPVSEVSEITAEPESKTFPFLLLPAEIRNAIYEYPCVWRTPMYSSDLPHHYRLNGPQQSPITRVNRQLRRETLGLFYWNHSFGINLPMLPIEDGEDADFNDYWYYGPQTMGFTMSAKELKDDQIPFTGQKFMDTDDLDWNDREEIKKAYLNTIKPYRLRKEAARAVGDGRIGTTAGATANIMSAVMWLIAGHCPQLTGSVTTWILPDGGVEEAFLSCWLSHLEF
ncbi:hypothetical protein F5883DRAFT_714622 [Diaporthe sp. PMI_573]|nr:hypothetical protein F5883DRAFT_714622 [Diaporthaceae sp. PMI_573]